MAKPLYYAKHKKLERLSKQLFGNSSVNTQSIVNEYNKKATPQELKTTPRFSQNLNKIRLREKINERKIQVNNKLNRTWSYGKIGRLFASILLPVIFLIGIGMTINVFASKTMIDGQEYYKTTPFEKVLGSLEIIAESGSDMKETLNNNLERSIVYSEMPDFKLEENQGISSNGLSFNIYRGFWNSPIFTKLENVEDEIINTFTFLWQIIKTPFQLTYKTIRYLMKDIK